MNFLLIRDLDDTKVTDMLIRAILSLNESIIEEIKEYIWINSNIYLPTMQCHTKTLLSGESQSWQKRCPATKGEHARKDNSLIKN